MRFGDYDVTREGRFFVVRTYYDPRGEIQYKFTAGELSAVIRRAEAYEEIQALEEELAQARERFDSETLELPDRTDREGDPIDITVEDDEFRVGCTPVTLEQLKQLQKLR